MDRLEVKKKIPEFIAKYKYALGILVLGMALMLIPGRIQKSTSEVPAETVVQMSVDLSGELSKILCKIEGVGQVEVLLTLASGEQTIYQQDTDISQSQSERSDTVIITDGDRVQSGLIQQVIPPQYLGAIVVCQGADSATVRLAVVEAVSRATGLGADRISVLKMK